MLRLDDDWVWDSWPLHEPDDEHPWHLFFLYAPRALRDPVLRHHHARIGHAAGPDLRTWTRLPDVVGPGPAGSVDDVATWTGSTVRGPDGSWHTYYTGLSRDTATGCEVQRVVRAVSDDLRTWRKDPTMPPLAADPRWYATTDSCADWPDEHWRDPWVYRDPDGDGWHLLVTARARPADHPDLHVDDLGVLGHAWSPDLSGWQVRPPLTRPGAGFGQLEVPQLVRVGASWWLVFSCAGAQLAPQRDAESSSGHWVVRDVEPTGPYDVAEARLLTDESLYAGRVVETADGPAVLAFDSVWGSDSGGSIGDPVPLPLDLSPSHGAPAPPRGDNSRSRGARDS